MNRLDSLFLPLFLAFLALWAGFSLYVLLNRVVYESHQRRRLQALNALRSPQLAALPEAERTRKVQAVLDALPASMQERLLADPEMPADVVEAFAAGQIARRGLARLLRDATEPSGLRGKWRRISAMVMLTRIGHDRARAVLERALHDPDPDLADAAVTLLGHLGDAAAAELLVAALTGSTASPSRIATQLEGFPPAIAPILRPLLQSFSARERYWAAALLAKLDPSPETARELKWLCKDDDANVRKVAVQGLGGLGGEGATQAALALVEDPVPFVRAHALRALGELGAVDGAARIAQALGDRDWWVRLAAKESLVKLGEPAWPAVSAQLEAEDGFARNGAAEVLQNQGLLDRWAAEALREPQCGAAERLARALRAGGEGMLEATLEHPDPSTRDRLRALLQDRERVPVSERP